MSPLYLKQKAVWALQQIWQPLKDPDTESCEDALRFDAPWLRGVELSIIQTLGNGPGQITLTRLRGEKRTGCLRCAPEFGDRHKGVETHTIITSGPIYPDERPKEFEQFALEHLLAFRRACWLSGRNIAVTGHEAMEWGLAWRNAWPPTVPYFDARTFLRSLAGQLK